MARAYEKDKKSGVWWKVLLTLAMLACVAVDAWYLYIHFFGQEKIISNTYEIDGITLADGSKENFIEVRYNANSDGSGYEMLDIKFNSLLDETRTMIVSQGLQFVSNSKDSGIEFVYVEDLENVANIQEGQWKKLEDPIVSHGGAFEVNQNTTTRYNYSSTDGYVTTGISTNPITNDSMFKITLGETNDIYGVKLTGKYDARDESNCVEANLYRTHQSGWWVFSETDNYYAYEDVNALSKRLYEYAKTLSAGTSHKVIVPFSDMFDYFKCSNGQYSNERLTATDLVELDINSYIVINFETFSSGAKKASDSLFNCLNGSQSFNMTGDYTSKDYFTGKTIVEVDLYDFNLVQVIDNYYCLKLREDFVENYLPYTSQILLSVEIDLDLLTPKGIEFYGFTEDSQLDKFSIHDCYTVYMAGGFPQRTEVAL